MEHMPEYTDKVAREKPQPSLVFRWVICSCGWSHMLNKRHWAALDRDGILRRAWFNHAYSSEEQAILRELGGDNYLW